MNYRPCLLVALAIALVVACDKNPTPPAAETPTVADNPAPQPEEKPEEKQEEEQEEKRVELHDYHELLALFDELNYTPEAWQAGVREVPRVYITEIPQRWREKTTKEVDVLTKKRLFFRAMAPLILQANELILADRTRVEAIASASASGSTVTAEDRSWLLSLAARYRAVDSADRTDSPDAAIDASLLDGLLARIDAVPPSLALAQAAEESGWGTSRFAAEGNALFGQWSWGKQAIKPEQQRAARGNYGIAAFETPLQSVLAYMQNLNTHRAYEGLRTMRAELRKAGKPVAGRELATTLDRYSERGQAYVDSLHAIMRVNRLEPTDQAYLGDGPPIYLFPTTDSAAP